LNEHIQTKLNSRYKPLYENDEIRRVLFARLGSQEKDEFGIKLKDAINQLDEKVRQRLVSRKNILKFWDR
jgi:hypothetical protein